MKGIIAILLLVFFSTAYAANSTVNQEAYQYVQQGMQQKMSFNDHRKAIEYFSKAIELDPKYADAYECRGLSYASSQIRDLKKALADFNKAIQLDSSKGSFYYGRALTYYYKKNYGNTWKDIHKAEELGFIVPPGFKNELRKVSKKES